MRERGAIWRERPPTLDGVRYPSRLGIDGVDTLVFNIYLSKTRYKDRVYYTIGETLD
jgi:hypothetical protein